MQQGRVSSRSWGQSDRSASTIGMGFLPRHWGYHKALQKTCCPRLLRTHCFPRPWPIDPILTPPGPVTPDLVISSQFPPACIPYPQTPKPSHFVLALFSPEPVTPLTRSPNPYPPDPVTPSQYPDPAIPSVVPVPTPWWGSQHPSEVALGHRVRMNMGVLIKRRPSQDVPVPNEQPRTDPTPAFLYGASQGGNGDGGLAVIA